MSNSNSNQGAPDEKKTTIIVNARPNHVFEDNLSYAQIVNLAYNDNPPSGENVVITLTYQNGVDAKQGSLLPGDTVDIKNGMIFHVSATNRS